MDLKLIYGVLGLYSTSCFLEFHPFGQAIFRKILGDTLRRGSQHMKSSKNSGLKRGKRNGILRSCHFLWWFGFVFYGRPLSEMSHTGLFNLCIVVLIAVNIRLIIENLIKYGLLIIAGFWFSSKQLRDWPFFRSW